LPVLVLAFLHLGLVPVQAQSALKNGARTGTLVQYQYVHIPLPELVSNNGSSTGIGICVLWFIISIVAGIAGTGIQWCPFRYWHFGTLVQYQYGHIP
jgi:hypothetical protein